MTAGDREAFLKSKLFSKLEIERFKADMKIITAKKGETIMTENNFSRCLALVLKGRASVSKIGLDGRRTIINRFSEGDVFGMATLFFEEEEYPSEITAENSLRLAVFPKETIEEAFFEYPDFAKAYVVLLSEKFFFSTKSFPLFPKVKLRKNFCVGF